MWGGFAVLKNKNKLERRNDDRHKRHNSLDQYQGRNNWLIVINVGWCEVEIFLSSVDIYGNSFSFFCQ